MASWTDQPYQFIPYVPQLPVQAEVAVGMEKQRRYDEGVQRIQSSIDRIAGLDIIRDVDKQYLNSKLSELGNNLKVVAAGDFSNYQLTNSVAGMASTIGRDPNIISAVSSTAFYKKQMDNIQKDVTAGKANPANNYRFNKRANEWLSSQELGKSFNTEYIPPVDVWKKIKDIAKEVGIDEQDIQQLYQTDTQGNIVYKDVIDPVTKKVVGKEPTWNPIMVEKVLKGKDAGKILNAFQSALTPQDYQQLAIEGEYNKASYTPDMLKAEIVSDSKEQIDFANGKIQDLKIALVKENEKNDKDPERIKSLNDQIDYYTKLSQSIVSSRDKSLATADSDPDSVRGYLYTNSYLHNMSKVLSSQDVSTKYSVSPMFTVTMEQNKFNWQMQQDTIKNKQWELTYEQRERALQAKGVGTKGGATEGLITEPIAITDPFMVKAQIEGDHTKQVEALNDVNSRIALEFYKKSNPSLSEDEIRRKIYTDSNGDLVGYTTKIASKQLEEWVVDPKNVPAKFRGLIEEQDRLSKEVSISEEEIKRVQTEAREIAKGKGLNVPTDDDVKRQINGKAIVLKSGRVINLSKEDMLDYANLHPNITSEINPFPDFGLGKVKRDRRDNSKVKLQDKFKDDFAEIENKLYGLDSVLPEVFGDRLSGRVAPLDSELRKTINIINSSDYRALTEIEAELYKAEGMLPQPLGIPLTRGKENKDDFDARISAVIDKYPKNESGAKSVEVLKMFLSDENAKGEIIATPGVGSYGSPTYELKITSKGKQASIIIDAEDYKTLSGQNSPINQPITVAGRILRNSHVTTTNRSGKDDPKTAWFTMKDFTKLSGTDYTATADLEKDAYNPNMVWMKIYLHDKKDPSAKPITLTFPDPDDTQQRFYILDPITKAPTNYLDSLPSGITDGIIEQLKRKR